MPEIESRKFLHHRIDMAEGEIVEVHIDGNEANVVLLDDEGLQRYRKGESFTHQAGGHMKSSPVRLRPPRPGAWNLVIDLGGRSGELSASYQVTRG